MQEGDKFQSFSALTNATHMGFQVKKNVNGLKSFRRDLCCLASWSWSMAEFSFLDLLPPSVCFNFRSGLSGSQINRLSAANVCYIAIHSGIFRRGFLAIK